MTIRYLCLLIFLFSCLLSNAQKEDYIWVTGRKNSATIIDFNNQIEVNTTVSDIRFDFTHTSICNAEGALQVVSNGCYVVDEHLQFMDDEDGIVITDDYKCGFQWPENGNALGWSQGALILALPGSDSLYYVFNQTAKTIGDPITAIYTNSLQYSIVDKSLREGKGGVSGYHNVIIEDTLYFENLCASLHNNEEDWWILQMAEKEGFFYKILFTELGVEKIDTQSIGIRHTWNQKGSSCFSPDGKHYARYIPGDGVYAYDFDNESGMLSNFRQVMFPDTAFVGSCAFSSNSRFLYVSAYDELFQIDFWEDDLQEGTVLVAERDETLGDPPFIVNFYQSQLAPDCKIYITPTFGWTVFSVIHAPNEPAEFCDFRQYSFDIHSQLDSGIPTFPHFRGLTDEVCDPTIVPTVYHLYNEEQYHIYPVPSADFLWLDYLQDGAVEHNLCIFDTSGQELLCVDLQSKDSEQVDISLLSSGIYYYRILDKAHQIVQQGKVVKM